MRFRNRRPESDYWSRVSLMAAVLVICLIGFFVWEHYSKKEPPTGKPARQVIHKKMPMRGHATSDVKLAGSVEEKKTPTARVGELKKETPDVVPEDEKPQKKQPVREVEGTYRVGKGDSLFKIAGREDVYGNPLKWPSLFRLNMSELNGMEISDDFEHKELPENLELRFVTSDEAADNMAKLDKKVWVVNALSSQTSKKIVPAAVKLMKNGYRVYISTAVVKGKEWMRLRVGFFGERARASAEGKKIRSLLESEGVWVASLGKQEVKEFGGY